MNEQLKEKVRIGDALKAKVMGILTEAEHVKENKKPSNVALWIAWFSFNFLLFVLDIGTAITVAMLTNVFYGLLTFLAGFLPTLFYEFLYIRAYASKYQQWIAIGGAVVGAGSTLLIGMLAAVVNVLKALEILTIASDAMMWIEIGMIVGLVVFAGLHVVLFSSYFYIDKGIQRMHERSQSLANVQVKLDSVKDSKVLALAGLDAAREVDQADDENLGDAVRMIYKKLTGNELLNGPVPALADQLFTRKEADTRFDSFRGEGDDQPFPG